MSSPTPNPSRRKLGTPTRASRAEIAGVGLTHPERVLYPDQGLTKLELAEFYGAIADWMLPRIAFRPLSLLRCPEGRAHECFFQKHPGPPISRRLARIDVREKSGVRPYLYMQKLSDLIALVQAGTLELHVWGSRVDDLERPDALVLDLDPGSEVAWRDVNGAALSLKARLADLGLESFVRTTGGKGLHVVAPLEPALDWDAVKAFARAVAVAHARDDPRKLTANMSKAKRRQRIFIDYLRNGRGATAIASYSTRARPGAPVAVPLRWNELSPSLPSDHYRVGNLRRRLAALRADPWRDFDAARRPLTPRMLAAAGAGTER